MSTVKIALPSWRYALIDADDEHKLDGYQWHFVVHLDAGKRYDYAIGIGCEPDKYRKVFMQNLVFGVDPEVPVKHVNGNTLDNRKENLKLGAEYLNNPF